MKYTRYWFLSGFLNTVTGFGRKTSGSLSTEEEDKSRAGSPTGQSGARRQQQKKPKKKKQA
jgi:hypothetical protein